METILEKLNGDNWSVLGEFETIQEVKDYLEVDWELDEERIEKAIKDLNFKPGETLVKNILGDGEVELYKDALKCELEAAMMIWDISDECVELQDVENRVLEQLGNIPCYKSKSLMEEIIAEVISSIENDKASMFICDCEDNEYKITIELRKSDIEGMVCDELLDKEVTILNIELI